MKCRIWRTNVVPGRFDEYETFARDVSLPMFRAQDGYAGLLMAGEGAERVVITLWRDADAVAALDRSTIYHETVKCIMATGFISGHQSVEVHDVHISDLYASSLGTGT